MCYVSFILFVISVMRPRNDPGSLSLEHPVPMYEGESTHDDVGRLDLLLLRLGAPHALLNLHAAPDLQVDAGVEEDQRHVREQLGEEGLRPEVIVDDVVLVGAQRRRDDDRPIVLVIRLVREQDQS